jgi:hypothetical protein
MAIIVFRVNRDRNYKSENYCRHKGDFNTHQLSLDFSIPVVYFWFNIENKSDVTEMNVIHVAYRTDATKKSTPQYSFSTLQNCSR